MAASLLVPCGPLAFKVEYRKLGGDEGLCVRVLSGCEEQSQELMRFDCFEQAPHYHYAPCGKNEVVPLDTTANGDAFDWVVERIRTRLRPMLVRAEAPSEAASLRDDELRKSVPELIRAANKLRP